MATSVAAAFKELKANLEITGLQKSTVSTRQQNVRDAVAKDLSMLDSFLTGSYSRSTMISPLKEADVDIFLVLDASYYSENGQASLLDKVRQTLLKTYTKSPKISRNGQAVTITFTDFIVDVVPGFYRKGGGFLIPDSHLNKWIPTDPKIHVSHATNHNKTHNGDLVPLIKMMKGWNKNKGFPFVSFYLELICINILNNVTITDFPSGMRYLFDKGREKIKYKVTDPAGYGWQINGLRETKTVKEAISIFQEAYDISRQAEADAQRGQISQAISSWKRIFGRYMPSYG